MDEQLAQMTDVMYASHGLFQQRCQRIVATETLCVMETVTYRERVWVKWRIESFVRVDLNKEKGSTPR